MKKKYLQYAQNALEDVLCYQIQEGPYEGANTSVWTFSSNGKDVFFLTIMLAVSLPYSRLMMFLMSSVIVQQPRKSWLLLKNIMAEDGSWPHIVYSNSKQASWPRWLAGTADILLSYHKLNEPLPEIALDRLLKSQLSNGAFPTAIGFSSQIKQTVPKTSPDYRDVTSVVGWNDKALRLLAELVEPPIIWPKSQTTEVLLDVSTKGQKAMWQENNKRVLLSTKGGNCYTYGIKKKLGQG